VAFILRPDYRISGCWTAVTAVTGPHENDWATALRRGYLHTPRPPRLTPAPSVRVRLPDTIAAVLAERRLGRREQVLARRIVSAQFERRRAARAARADVIAANRAVLTRRTKPGRTPVGYTSSVTTWVRPSRGGMGDGGRRTCDQVRFGRCTPSGVDP
jgi:hypothetical protein